MNLRSLGSIGRGPIPGPIPPHLFQVEEMRRQQAGCWGEGWGGARGWEEKEELERSNTGWRGRQRGAGGSCSPYPWRCSSGAGCSH